MLCARYIINRRYVPTKAFLTENRSSSSSSSSSSGSSSNLQLFSTVLKDAEAKSQMEKKTYSLNVFSVSGTYNSQSVAS